MALTGMQGGINNPDPMQLPPHGVGIHELGKMGDINRRTAQFVVVVGDQHFLFAEKLPVITVQRAIETVVFIKVGDTVRESRRCIVFEFRQMCIRDRRGCL